MKPTPEQEAEFMRLAATAMADNNQLVVSITIRDAWLLVSGLQLAASHPAISGHMLQALTHIARQFQARIVDAHPEVGALLEKGWDRQYDVEQTP